MFKGGKIFGREPVLITAFFAVVLQVISSLVLPLSTENQALLNGAFALVLGFVAAASVSLEKAVPALIGALQAIAAVAVGFGFHVSPDVVTAITGLVAAGAALWVRTQVVAPVAAGGANAVKAL